MPFKSREEIAYQYEPKHNERGGIELVDDGSDRLRDVRPTDTHPADCPCMYCRQVCCVLCHQADPSIVKVRRSLTGFARHVQAAHPSAFGFDSTKRRAKRLTKQLQELAVAKQAKSFERSGLRRIPIHKITEQDIKTLNKWIKGAREGGAADPILLTALEMADERFPTQARFEATVRALNAEVERGIKTGTFTTAERKTQFDPRVAIELLKLCYGLGKGWSFIVHLVLLYGLRSFSDTLTREGLSPPTSVASLPKPAQIIDAHAKLAKEIMNDDAQS